MVTMEIDGKTVKVEKGTSILKAARTNGIEIPTLCYHEALDPWGGCRVCTVEITEKDNRNRLVTSCNYQVEEGLRVETQSEAALAVRKMVIKLLLARCPNMKVIKELAAELGVEETPFKIENEVCILCGLCVRTCQEVVGANAITFVDKGPGRKVASPFFKPSKDCIGCGACVYVCPTNCISMKDVEEAADFCSDGKERVGYARLVVNWRARLKLQECKQCGNPFAPEVYLKRMRDQKNLPVEFFNLCPSCRRYPIVDEEKCLGCGGCMENCPVGALEFEDKGGYNKKAHVYTQNCIGCHSCEPMCPVQAIS